MTKRGSEECSLLSSASSLTENPSLLMTSSVSSTHDPSSSSLHNNNITTSSKKVKIDPESESKDSIITANNGSNTTTITANMNGSATEEPTSGSNNNNNNNNGTPSKVVHVRNVPPDAHESDLMNLALPFGKVSNLLLLRGKNQAMVEFADLSSAQCMVTYWQQHTQPTVRGRNVYCQFSNHQQIKQSDNNNPNMNGSFGHNNQGNHDVESSTNETPVLRVVVDQLLYPVNVDHFYQLFSRYGKVSKVVTFQKNSSFQALIQFEQIAVASAARQGLDGSPMFGPSTPNSNILRVGFSKLTNLNVKFNNDKSRDYTNPGLPSGQSSGQFGSTAGGENAAALSHALAMADPVTLAAFAATHGPASAAAAAAAAASALGYPNALHNMPHAGGPHSGQGHHGQHHGHPNMGGGYASGNGAGRGMSRDVGHLMNSNQHAALMGFGSVLLASNLPEQVATPDALFTLFGVFGDVVRVKVLFNRKDNALIQMAESQQAQVATQHLDRLQLMGRTLKVNASRHGVVQLPKEGQPDAGLTKDFANSTLHRFKKPGSKNYSNIFPPSTTLHLSNIPSTVSEEELLEVFRREVRPEAVTAFKFFPKDRKMALISFATLDDSVMALVRLHNYQLADSAHLRVSFSKSSI